MSYRAEGELRNLPFQICARAAAAYGFACSVCYWMSTVMLQSPLQTLGYEPSRIERNAILLSVDLGNR